MTTFTTGIPRMRRNIQPPPIPVVRMTISKSVVNAIGDVLEDDKVFHITISGDNGYYASSIPISRLQPLVFNSLQYGTYTITEGSTFGYVLTSITPSIFTLSATNPQQTVAIVNTIQLGVVTVTKLITGVTEDETYFDVVITGQGADPIEQSGQVRLGEPLVFYDLPLDDYVITELAVDGYTLTSITPSTVTIDSDNLSDEVVIVNEIESPITPIELGALYNWYAASKNGGSGIGSIAPEGWHVPTYVELQNLQNYCFYISKPVLDTNPLYWLDVSELTNEYGLSLRGSGVRRDDGVFMRFQREFHMWSNEIDPYEYNQAVELIATPEYGFLISTNFDWIGNGFSIRLLKNTSDWIEGETVTDVDGNVYGTVKIGDQVWITANLSVTKYNDSNPIPNITDNSLWGADTDGAYCWYNNDINNK